MLVYLFLMLTGVCFCERLEIQMPNVDILEKDSYMCFATPVSQLSGYTLVGYDIDTTKGLTHHTSMAACEHYGSNVTFWDCKHEQGHVCSGRAVSLHGQSGSDSVHAEMSFRKDVGLHLGYGSNINYIILQVHYGDLVRAEDHQFATTNVSLILSKERRQYTMQDVELGANGFIPPFSEDYSCEMIMEWRGVPVIVHTYSGHTHGIGLMTEGYLIRNETTTLIARHSAEYQGRSTYAILGGGEQRIQPGDFIAARCTYSNPTPNKVFFGHGHGDEMCNFNLYFEYPSDQAMVYPRSLRIYQNCQNTTWCKNDVLTTSDLCYT